MRVALWLVPWLAACSAPAHQIAIGPPPDRTTKGVLAGPLCEGKSCKCRDKDAAGDGGAGFPDEAKKKRFEFRIGPSAQEEWVTVGEDVLYKDPERTEECFYVDLSPGETFVELRASDKNAVSAAWSIHELGKDTKSWYDTFAFNCGSPGACSYEELDEMKPKFAAYKHHAEDLCGSVKIKGLSWDTGHSPDQNHPSELVVRLSLDVYKRAPTQPHGDPSCATRPPLTE